MIVPNDVKIEDFIAPYTMLSNPIPCNGLFLYPVKMKDLVYFLSDINVLNIEKNKIADLNIIQMSYLKFLFNIMLNEEGVCQKFIRIISLCFRLKEKDLITGFDKNKILAQVEPNKDKVCFINGWDIKFIIGKNDSICLYINDVKFTPKEFDEVRRIIMYQNMVGYDDTEMDEDFKKAVQEYYAIKSRGIVQPTIEDKIDIVMSQTSYSEEEISEMTYRRFEKIFNKIVEKTEYTINKMAQIQGAIKGDVEHWVYKSNKNKYEDVFSSADEFENKINSIQ